MPSAQARTTSTPPGLASRCPRPRRAPDRRPEVARSGHCQMLANGSDLAAQVGYRLAGISPDKSMSREAQEAQVDYRIGDGSVDSREVWFLGSGATSERMEYRPGQRVTAADGRIVRDAMFGIDRQTGERIRVRKERNRQARIAAAPYASVLREASTQAGVDLADVWMGRNLAAQLRALMKSAERRNGTIVIRSAESLLRSNEHAWKLFETWQGQGRDVESPPFRLERSEVMRRLGAHHRALEDAGQPQEFGGKPIDISLPDEALGRSIWEHVIEQSQQMTVTGNAGYEMTLTCPKSFSVAAFVADPATRAQWLGAVHDSVTGATDELMRRVGHGRTGHEGDGQTAMPIKGLGYAATVSLESYSRELDPHLHGHVMIPNRVLCVDGVERTIATGGSDLVNHSWWFQAEFERRLRAISTQRGLVTGWEFDLEDRQWEVAGADPEIMGFYSQAQALVRSEILEALDGESVSVSRPRLQVLDSRAKRKVTRTKGEETLSWGAIRARMIDRARVANVEINAAFSAPVAPVWSQPGAWDEDIWARTVEQVVCENKGAEITARIEAAVRCFAPHEWSEEQVFDMVRTVIGREFTTGETQARGRVGVRRHASNRVADAERRACEAFTDGFDRNVNRVDPAVAETALELWRQGSGWAAEGRDFTPGQVSLFRQMTSGSDRVSTVVGAAGSGKTTAIDAARSVLASRGQRVFGVCVAAIAAQAMRDTAKVQAGTVTWLTMRIDFERDPLHPARVEMNRLAQSGRVRDRARAERIRTRFALPAMDHLVIDEASMIPATDMATVLEWTAQKAITVTLIGDHRQLQPVGPSGLFRQFHQTKPGAELTENMRQRTDVGRECAAFLRDGDAEQALMRLSDGGQLVVVGSQTEAERVLVSAWAERAALASSAMERLHSTGLESDRNDQVEILNHLARSEARTRGWISGPDRTFNDRGRQRVIAVGDQIVITRNISRGADRSLVNGTRALVTQVDEKGIQISYQNAGELRSNYLTGTQVMRNCRHGYAMTTHKLQGQTVSSLVIDIGPDRDLSSAYVAFTRHRDDVLAVVNIADIAEGDQLEALMAAGPDARRDAVIVMMAERMQRRGFSESVSAHAAIGTPLPLLPRQHMGLGVS